MTREETDADYDDAQRWNQLQFKQNAQWFEIDKLKAEIGKLKAEVSNLKSETGKLRTDLSHAHSALAHTDEALHGGAEVPSQFGAPGP